MKVFEKSGKDEHALFLKRFLVNGRMFLDIFRYKNNDIFVVLKYQENYKK